jgi:hypothetical protein
MVRARLLSQKRDEHFERAKTAPLASVRVFERGAPSEFIIVAHLLQAEQKREITRFPGCHRGFQL